MFPRVSVAQTRLQGGVKPGVEDGGTGGDGGRGLILVEIYCPAPRRDLMSLEVTGLMGRVAVGSGSKYY